jgi:hypothetical protein
MGYGPGPELGRYSYGFRGSPMPVCLQQNHKLVLSFLLGDCDHVLSNRFLVHGLVEH